MDTITDKSVAVEILKQLGGHHFIAMTGARNFICDNNMMAFKIPSTMTKNRISHIRITLNSMDTYDIEFLAIRGQNIKKVSEFNDIYNDGLRNLISSEIGLTLTIR